MEIKRRRPKRSNRWHSISEISESMQLHKGYLTKVAQHIEMSLSALWLRVQKEPTLKALHDELLAARDVEICNTAEDKLQEAMERGDEWAVKLALARKAKSRGYSDDRVTRAEIEQVNGEQRQKTIIVIPSNGREDAEEE